ncbi:MAG: S8 family serine peptidase [Rhizobacter sp.]|nr:S8 family serine peptidase [Rhizobacter sp.]
MITTVKPLHLSTRLFAGALFFWIVVLLLPQPAHAGGPQSAAGTAADEALPTDRLIIKYRSHMTGAAAGAAAADRAALHRGAQEAVSRLGHRLQLLRVGALDTHVMRLERRMAHGEVQALAREVMAADPGIEYAEPDRILRPLLVPTDTQYGQQWHYFESAGGLNLPAAWDKSTGAGVVVAVIDTGYRPHADLAANILPGYDFINDTAVSNDGNGRDASALDPGDAVRAGECGGGYPAQDLQSSWHGTHVAGTVAALTNNSAGVAGVAFGAKVLPVRVLGKCGGYTSDITAGIIWASGGSVPGVPANANPARVINLSLGGSGTCDAASRDAINSARSRGTVVVVAAGNSNANAANYTPASCAGVVTVAATNRSGGRAYYSNYGSAVAVAAPGGDMRAGAANGILSTLNSGSTAPGADAFAHYQGTSMAAPHVAGVVALMLAKNGALTPDEVAARLKASARPFPATCSQCGSGIVDASAAVDAAAGGGSPPPPPPSGNEIEPNDSFATAQAVTLGTTINGTMAASSDNDFFRVEVAAGRSLTATLTPGGSSDYDLYIYNVNGALVARSTRGTGQVDSSTVTNSGTSTATAYVRVRFYGGGTGATAGAYTLSIR